MLCAISYYLYNLKNVKNTHEGGVLLKPATLLTLLTFKLYRHKIARSIPYDKKIFLNVLNKSIRQHPTYAQLLRQHSLPMQAVYKKWNVFRLDIIPWLNTITGSFAFDFNFSCVCFVFHSSSSINGAF